MPQAVLRGDADEDGLARPPSSRPPSSLGHLPLTAAETARLRYLASVYADEKGGGLKLPEGVACDDKGQLVIGDTGNDRLLRFTLRGRKA